MSRSPSIRSRFRLLLLVIASVAPATMSWAVLPEVAGYTLRLTTYAGSNRSEQWLLLNGDGTYRSYYGWGHGHDTNHVRRYRLMDEGTYTYTPSGDGLHAELELVTSSGGAWSMILRYNAAASGDIRSGALGSFEFSWRDSTQRLVNSSVRASLAPGKSLLAGFVSGAGGARVLIRAIGPTLADYGVDRVVSQPVIRLHQGDQVLATSGKWTEGDADNRWPSSDMLEGVFAVAGAFPLSRDNADSALVADLPPGVYTAMATNDGQTEGEALLEIYVLP